MTEETKIAITISRQFGAGGAVLGQRLAKRLDIAYLDRDILQMAAERMGERDADLSRWEERLPSFWERFIQTLSVGSPDSISNTVSELPGISGRKLFEMESRVIREVAARRSVVVIGRAAAWVLKDHPRLVRVYLHAPLSARLPVIQQRLNLRTEQDARKMIDRVDSERERFVHETTGLLAGDARNYDLCINVDQAGMDLAEEMILRDVERVRLGPPRVATWTA